MVSRVSRLYFVALLVLVLITIIFRAKFLKWMADTDKESEYELVRKYLLNDSPLYGHKRPKLWVHSSYAYNERLWKSFRDRGSLDLNQPYLHLTIRTIINHCGNDFNVCLIDDNTFGRIIPSWTVDMNRQSETMKVKFREYGMAQLVYFYGGMVVPNSFICTRNLSALYRRGVNANLDEESDVFPSSGTRMFVVERPNRRCDNAKDIHGRLLFLPDLYFFGAPKNHPMVLKLCEYLRPEPDVAFFSAESEFMGRTGRWLYNRRAKSDALESQDKTAVFVVSGEHTGVKTVKQTPVGVEKLLHEAAIDFDPDKLFGVFIPAQDILDRTHYEFFASLPAEAILTRSNLMASKYLQYSMVESSDLQSKLVRTKKEKNPESIVVL